MGGKSRKKGTVSRHLINRLKKSNIGKSGCCANKETRKEDGFGLADDPKPRKE